MDSINYILIDCPTKHGGSIAGVKSEECNHFNLEDPLDYALLASSGCYCLPYGPFSDDAITMEDLCAAMCTLGFKPKHMSGIFSLVAILMLGNIQFGKANHQDISAYISYSQVVDLDAWFLGVSSEDLSQMPTNRTNYVHKELYMSLLNAENRVQTGKITLFVTFMHFFLL